MRHPTIYDVAEAAGVSIGTVSKTLNHPSTVSAATRAKVLDAVDRLGFVPKEEATSRARRGVGRIGVMAPFSSYPSFSERLNGVLEVARGRPAEVVVYDFDSPAASATLLESLPTTRSLDGLIIMALPLAPSVADRLRASRLPVVLVEMTADGFSSVEIDDAGGGRLAAGRLLATGRRRFAFLGERQRLPDMPSPSRRRLEAFRAALADRGIPLGDGAVVLAPNDADGARAAADSLFSGGDPPDAVFAHSDELAAAALAAARARGLRVPDDVGIVGFDDSRFAAALDLTTIRQPLAESGAWAADRLVQQLADPAGSVAHIRLPVTLTVRGSA